MGDPKSPDTNMGPLISKEHLEKVKSFIYSAQSEGATILCGEGVDPLELPAEKKGVYNWFTIIDAKVLLHSSFLGFFRCVEYNVEFKILFCNIFHYTFSSNQLKQWH